MSTINEQINGIMNNVNEQINKSVGEMAQSVADIIQTALNDRMVAIETENKRLQGQVTDLTTRLQTLTQTSDQKYDNVEQYSRRNSLRISGVEESPGESTDDIILDLAKQCNVNITLQEIDRSHRLQPRRSTAGANSSSRPRDIIVKFISYRSRSAFFRGKSVLKSSETRRNIFINEDLTKYRAEILRSARNLVKNKNSNVVNAWSSDGRIYIKAADGTRRHISSSSDLAKYN